MTGQYQRLPIFYLCKPRGCVSSRNIFRIDQKIMPSYLCSLILEPHLHDSHRQSSLSCKSFSDLQQQCVSEMDVCATYYAHRCQVTADLSAGFGRHLEGSLEGPTLLRGQDGAGSLGSLVFLPIIPSLPPDGDTATLFILTFYCRGNLSIGLKLKCVISILF